MKVTHTAERFKEIIGMYGNDDSNGCREFPPSEFRAFAVTVVLLTEEVFLQ